MVSSSPMLHGFLSCLSLIVGLGAQNVFIIRQGLRNSKIFIICLTSALSDAILISTGVAGFSKLTKVLPWLPRVMQYGGTSFLTFYGTMRFKSSIFPDTDEVHFSSDSDEENKSIANQTKNYSEANIWTQNARKELVSSEAFGNELSHGIDYEAITDRSPTRFNIPSVVYTTLAFSWLNPNVYLNTVGLLGAISSSYEGQGRVYFGVGAVSASVIFFFFLGYASKLLSPILRKRSSWQVLDFFTGQIMLYLAFTLVFDVKISLRDITP